MGLTIISSDVTVKRRFCAVTDSRIKSLSEVLIHTLGSQQYSAKCIILRYVLRKISGLEVSTCIDILLNQTKSVNRLTFKESINVHFDWTCTSLLQLSHVFFLSFYVLIISLYIILNKHSCRFNCCMLCFLFCFREELEMETTLVKYRAFSSFN